VLYWGHFIPGSRISIKISIAIAITNVLELQLPLCEVTTTGVYIRKKDLPFVFYYQRAAPLLPREIQNFPAHIL